MTKLSALPLVVIKFFVHFIHFIILFGKYGLPYLGSCKSSATQSYKCILSLFVFP